MRGKNKTDGTYDPPPTRVFHPGGQYNPRPTLSPQENALPPPATSFIMSGLDPYTWYEFQVKFYFVVEVFWISKHLEMNLETL